MPSHFMQCPQPCPRPSTLCAMVCSASVHTKRDRRPYQCRTYGSSASNVVFPASSATIRAHETWSKAPAPSAHVIVAEWLSPVIVRSLWTRAFVPDRSHSPRLVDWRHGFSERVLVLTGANALPTSRRYVWAAPAYIRDWFGPAGHWCGGLGLLWGIGGADCDHEQSIAVRRKAVDPLRFPGSWARSHRVFRDLDWRRRRTSTLASAAASG